MKFECAGCAFLGISMKINAIAIVRNESKIFLYFLFVIVVFESNTVFPSFVHSIFNIIQWMFPLCRIVALQNHFQFEFELKVNSKQVYHSIFTSFIFPWIHNLEIKCIQYTIEIVYSLICFEIAFVEFVIIFFFHFSFSSKDLYRCSSCT